MGRGLDENEEEEFHLRSEMNARLDGIRVAVEK